MPRAGTERRGCCAPLRRRGSRCSRGRRRERIVLVFLDVCRADARRRARRSPRQQCIESRAQRLAPVGQAVLDLRRHLLMHDATNYAVLLELTKLLDQHLLRDRWDLALELRKAQQLAVAKGPQQVQVLSGKVEAIANFRGGSVASRAIIRVRKTDVSSTFRSLACRASRDYWAVVRRDRVQAHVANGGRIWRAQRMARNFALR
jgi:hypothetical protein